MVDAACPRSRPPTNLTVFPDAFDLASRMSIFLDEANFTDATRAGNADSICRCTSIETSGRRVHAGVRVRL